eukprot:12055999-Ditylum_brightwellii.AAC.1
MLHGTALATLASYGIYKEVCEGELDPAWKNDDPAQYWEFRDGLSTQMCCYNPIHHSYPGDGLMRPSVSQNSSKRRASECTGAAARASMTPTRKKCGSPSMSSCLAGILHPKIVSLVKHFKDAKTKCGTNSRLCRDLNDFKRHTSSAITGGKHGKACRPMGLIFIARPGTDAPLVLSSCTQMSVAFKGVGGVAY